MLQSLASCLAEVVIEYCAVVAGLDTDERNEVLAEEPNPIRVRVRVREVLAEDPNPSISKVGNPSTRPVLRKV